jgi:hypothetical protein
MTPIESAKMNGLDRINDHWVNRLDELLPRNRAPQGQQQAA